MLNNQMKKLENTKGSGKDSMLLILFGKYRRESFEPQAYCIVIQYCMINNDTNR